VNGRSENLHGSSRFRQILESRVLSPLASFLVVMFLVRTRHVAGWSINPMAAFRNHSRVRGRPEIKMTSPNGLTLLPDS
jgi:hypothetical protein